MQVIEHHTLDELRTMARRTRDARMLRRLQIIILATQQHTAPQIATTLNLSRRSVQISVYRYNDHGLDGLADRRCGGNRNKLTEQEEQQLIEWLDRQADDPHESVRFARQAGQWIEQHFGKAYSLSGLYVLLHRLGYRWLMPRSRHRHADAEAQEAFKKAPPRRSTTSPRSIRTNASKSGSRTKPVSANRVR
ncbi:MAG: helix-turn-helix domain-containing protein [Shimia sp.]|jgi:transposase|nr:helix-turn-helix domain-containing protein [Gammaproteobacteria bacterium]MCP4819849.1 helix-turn-helix domain-containing protein [Shimia sp.]MCP4852997.1 helix-turn-helix domain-containing protein [Fuerstiella sp.]MDP7348665.1 winged helix-turn-helix domain-containing protein [Phycisphaeraceae bacterium]